MPYRGSAGSSAARRHADAGGRAHIPDASRIKGRRVGGPEPDGGGAARHRGRPAPPRCRDRRRRGAADVRSGKAASPARPLHRRGSFVRRDALDRLPHGLLPVGERARQAVPTALSRATRQSLPGRHGSRFFRARRSRTPRPSPPTAPGCAGSPGRSTTRAPFGGPEPVRCRLVAAERIDEAAPRRCRRPGCWRWHRASARVPHDAVGVAPVIRKQAHRDPVEATSPGTAPHLRWPMPPYSSSRS
jgi:hypothetical protein